MVEGVGVPGRGSIGEEDIVQGTVDAVGLVVAVGGVADADVVVEDVVGEAAAGAVGLDADAVVGAIEREVGDTDGGDAAVGLGADGHAVAVVEVVVGDGHVDDATGTAFDGYVVVAGADEAVGDGDVAGAATGVDAVGVAGEALGGVDAEAPRR